MKLQMKNVSDAQPNEYKIQSKQKSKNKILTTTHGYNSTWE
jgi:hypothetical protein